MWEGPAPRLRGGGEGVLAGQAWLSPEPRREPPSGGACVARQASCRGGRINQIHRLLILPREHRMCVIGIIELILRPPSMGHWLMRCWGLTSMKSVTQAGMQAGPQLRLSRRNMAVLFRIPRDWTRLQ
ncbi:uncharacterized protein LOC144292990 isoform X2 [Canis aureus]